MTLCNKFIKYPNKMKLKQASKQLISLHFDTLCIFSNTKWIFFAFVYWKTNYLCQRKLSR